MKPNLSVIVIRAAQTFADLDRPTNPTVAVTITRRGGQSPRKVELPLQTAQAMQAALERAGWRVAPSLRDSFGWVARP